MKAYHALALALAAVLLVTALAMLVNGPASQSPLAQFYKDGKLSIPGGKLTPELQKLLFPPPAPKTYMVFSKVRSSYSTMAFEGSTKPVETGTGLPDPVDGIRSFGNAISKWLGPAPDFGGAARGAVSWFLGLFTQNGAAACGAGGGACFRITSGDNWTTSNSWSASTGGASCGAACVPAATDTATFDSNTPAGNVTMDATVTVAALTIDKDTLVLGHFDLTINGNLSLGGGAINETGNHIDTDTVTGNVNISSASSYIAFGKDNWFVDGSWTNASTSVSWAPGSGGSMTFQSTSDQAMTFAGSNLAVAEFDTVGFRSTSLGTVTFTMNTRGLVWATILHIHSQNATGTTVLVTSGLPMTGGELHMADDARKGTLTASNSTVSITNWTNNASAANTITVTTGAWTLSGNYSGPNSNTTFTWGVGSSITFTGAAKTINDAELGGGFYTVNVSGTYSMLTAIAISHQLNTSGTGVLTTGGFNITGGAALSLVGTGGLTGSSSTVTFGTVTIGAGTTLSMSSGTINIAGNWDSTAAGFFVCGTSTVALSVTASISVGGSTGSAAPCGAGPYGNRVFYNLNIAAAGTITTVPSTLIWTNILTLGTGTVTGPNYLYNTNYATAQANPISNAGATINTNITFDRGSATNINLPAITLSGFIAFSQGALSGGWTAFLTGPLTSTAQAVQVSSYGGSTVILDTGAGNQAINARAISISSNGQLNANASIITLNVAGASWDSSLGTFNCGTSTIVTTVNASLTFPGAGPQYSYNVTVNASTVATIHGWMAIRNVVTVNGNVNMATASDRTIIYDFTSTTNPIVFGASGSITASAAPALLQMATQTSPASIHIPAGTYTNVGLYLNHRGAGVGQGMPYVLDGNASFYEIEFDGVPADPFFLNTQTFNVTAGYEISTFFGSGSTVAGIVATSGTWTVGGLGGSGGVKASGANAQGFYISFGATTWTVHSNWAMISTDSTYWDAGTSTVTLDDNVAPGTLQFAGAGLGEAEFYNLTFAEAAPGGATFTLQNNGVWVGNTLTVGGGAFSTIVDLSASNYPITATSLLIGANGTLNGRGSTISIYNWTNVAGAFTYGTSTLDFVGNGTATWPVGVEKDNYNIKVEASVTTTSAGYMYVRNALTIDGALSLSLATSWVIMYDYGGLTDPLVLGGSGTLTALAAPTLVLFAMQAAAAHINIPAATYTNIELYLNPRVAGAAPGLQFVTLGNVSAYQLAIDAATGKPFYLNTGTNDFLMSYQISTIFLSGAVSVGIVGTSGTWSTGSGGFINNVSGTAFYLQLGSVTFNEQGPWTNTSTSASWNAGTSTVVFGPQSNYNYTFSTTLGAQEFYDVVFTGNLIGAPGFNYAPTQQSNLVVGHNFTVEGSLLGSVTLMSNGFNITVNGDTVMDALGTYNGTWQMSTGTINLLGSFTIREYDSPNRGGSLLVQSATFSVHGDFNVLGNPAHYGIDFGSSHFHFYGSTFLQQWYLTLGTSTFYWDGTGDQVIDTSGMPAPQGWAAYNLQIATTSTLRYDSKVIILNVVTTAGGIRPVADDPTIHFFIEGATSCQPLVLSPGYNFINAWIQLLFAKNCATYHVQSGTYSHLEVRLDLFPASTASIVLDGNIQTKDCPVGFDSAWCAFLVTGPSGAATFDTQGFNVTLGTGAVGAVGGVWFIGDYQLSLDSIAVHMRTSVVTAYGGIGIAFSTTTFFDGATVNAYPENLYKPAAIYGGGTGPVVVYGGTATLNVHGAIIMWSTGVPGGETMEWFAQNSTVNLINDQPCSAGHLPPNPSGVTTCGGDVNIAEQTSFIDFGNSVWNVSGNWRNASTSASWNAASGIVNFTGNGTITTPALVGMTLPEFATVNFPVGASPTLGANPLTFKSLNIVGAFNVDGHAVTGINMAPSTGYISLDAWLAFSVGQGEPTDVEWHFDPSAAGATVTIVFRTVNQDMYYLTRDGSTVQQAQATATVTFSVTGGWSPHTMAIISSPSGGPTVTSGSPPSGFQFVCDQGPLDWLMPLYVRDTVTVTFSDGSSMQTGATVYLWDFGDGTTLVSQGGFVTHTYKAGSLYTAYVEVHYSSGAINSYFFRVDARGANCSLQTFTRIAIIPMYAAGAILAVGAGVTLAAKKTTKSRLFKVLAALAAVAFLVPLVIYIYAYLAGIPI